MPKIAVYKYFTFFFLSFDLTEPYHLHVRNNKGYSGEAAKIWLDGPEIASAGSLTDKELNTALKIIEKNRERIVEQIDNFAKGQKIKTLNLN